MVNKKKKKKKKKKTTSKRNLEGKRDTSTRRAFLSISPDNRREKLPMNLGFLFFLCAIVLREGNE